MFAHIQQISNHGTSNPIVARTWVQGSEILKFFAADGKTREEALAVLEEMQRHLLRCFEEREKISLDVHKAHGQIAAKGILFQAGIPTLPSVPDLQSKAESFLQSAKLAIRQTGLLLKPFYGVTMGHKYNDMTKWAEKEFGPKDEFAKMLRASEPWVNSIIMMRNGVDHPEGHQGRLTTKNFTIRRVAGSYELVDPTWGLSSAELRPLVPEMDEILDGVLELGEEVLICLFEKRKTGPLVIYETPIAERDSNCPKRFSVGLPPEAFGSEAGAAGQ